MDTLKDYFESREEELQQHRGIIGENISKLIQKLQEAKALGNGSSLITFSNIGARFYIKFTPTRGLFRKLKSKTYKITVGENEYYLSDSMQSYSIEPNEVDDICGCSVYSMLHQLCTEQNFYP